jgi:hypothetical protein
MSGEGRATVMLKANSPIVAVLLLVALTITCRPAPVDKNPNARPKAASSPIAGAASGKAEPAQSASSAASAAVVATSRLEPLAAASALIALQVPGFREAVVSVPLGATEPRPTVVALHGNFDRPEWQCEVMRDITGGYPFVLCPRGIPRTDVPKSWDRWEYGGLGRVKQELDAGLVALELRFPGYVAQGPIVFTGFSLGAILGRPLVNAEAGRFPRVMFTEGGNRGWNFKRFKELGGERIAFACAQAGCLQNRRLLAKQAARLGVEVHVADGGNVGHTYDGPVARAIQAEWAWLVEGDKRWDGWRSSSK